MPSYKTHRERINTLHVSLAPGFVVAVSYKPVRLTPSVMMEIDDVQKRMTAKPEEAEAEESAPKAETINSVDAWKTLAELLCDLVHAWDLTDTRLINGAEVEVPIPLTVEGLQASEFDFNEMLAIFTAIQEDQSPNLTTPAK